MMNQIITYSTVLFLILGGIDYLLGNKFGIGVEFEKGILASGRLLLCMTGFLTLAPVIANILAPIVVPLFRSIGADPSLFAGMIFANDSGGAALAMEIADSADMGLFSGLIVGAMMGTTVMFVIPLSIANTLQEQRSEVIYGLLSGIITIPFGCIAGGFAAGFSLADIVRNTIPVIAISIFLALMLVFCRKGIVKALTMFGQGILIMSTTGLMISAIQQLSGRQIAADMAPLDEVSSIVVNICIFLAGVFPMIAVMQKVFSRPLKLLGQRIGINEPAISGLLLCLANGIPVFSLLKDMDAKGRMVNVAFLVSASCLLGDHLAYTTQVAPQMCSAVIIGKLAGSVSALILSIAIASRLLNKHE